MSKIKAIRARQILDSRGNPTVEVDLETQSGHVARASVPSGASTGTREALELRDGDKNYYLGKSVLKVVENIKHIIAPALEGMDVMDLKSIDEKMLQLDGDPFKKNLGANALLAVSMASARAGAMHRGISLYRHMTENLNAPRVADFQGDEYLFPTPLMNIINGGAHASNGLDIQEFMIVPHLPRSFAENLRAGTEIFHSLKKVLSEKGLATNVGDEGGFAPNFSTNQEAFDSILTAIERAGFKPGEEISLALDCAASEFYDLEAGTYKMEGKTLTSDQMTEYYQGLVERLPLYSIEDGLDERDNQGWINLTAAIGEKVTLVGDDLFVTNPQIFKEGIESKMANAILVKINQIGTISETFEAIKMAFDNNYKAIISHRSGETADAFIADLAVATGAGHIKTGSLCRTDRIEKYNQLLRIEEELGKRAIYKPVR